MKIKPNKKFENSAKEKWKPGVPNSVLLLIAGIVWIGMGTLLAGFAYSWLRDEQPGHALWAALIGFACGLVVHHFGFLHVVDKNLGRILPMEGKRCVFAFMPWKSYILVIIMMATGILLRHSPIPKLYLAVLYAAIGTALILSSIRYLRYLILTIKNK
jgi:hypothetical protein